MPPLIPAARNSRPRSPGRLPSRRLSAEVAAARGYRSIFEPQDLLDLGYAEGQARLAPGLLVPLWDVYGENGASQFRPDTPRERDGKPVKYETPDGARNMLDIHSRMLPHLGNPTVPIIFTEGVREADASTSRGYLSIALTGVYGWPGQNGYGVTTPLGDFEQIPLKGRKVFLIFDSDTRDNANVQLALTRFPGRRNPYP